MTRLRLIRYGLMHFLRLKEELRSSTGCVPRISLCCGLKRFQTLFQLGVERFHRIFESL